VASAGGNVAPDGNVVFYDGSTVLGASPVSPAGVATITATSLVDGVHSIVASYGGDTSNQIQGSSSPIWSQDVLAASAVQVTSSLNPSPYGVPVTLNIAITKTGSTSATGTVTILDGASQIGTVTLTGGTGQATFTTAALVVGSHALTVSYSGDANYGPGTSPVLNQVVNQAQTTTAEAAAPNPAFAGGALAVTATVKLTQGVNVPTGTVTFTAGALTLGSAALGASGTATVNTTLPVGNYSIIATYSGDVNDAGSASSGLPLTVQIATTATALSANPSPAIVDSAVSLIAKVTGNGGVPTGAVTFTADGVNIGTVTLDPGGTATLSNSSLAPGTHAILANYAGDANDSPSASQELNLLVTTIPTATALGASSSSGASSQVSLVATVIGSSGPTPTGTVTFTNGSTVIGAATLNSSGVATLYPNLGTGSYSIVAAYGGDVLHSPSTSLPATVSGTPTSFNISVNPPTVTMATSQNATVTITFTSISGFSDSLGLGCASLPAAVNCHFSSPSVKLAAGGTQTATLTIDTNNPLSGGSSAMNSNTAGRRTYMAGLSLLALPFTVLFGVIVWRFRKRHSPVFTAALVLLLAGAAMLVNGCSGFSQVTAAPGTYVIQVTATGTNSDVVHYQSITLNITH
jgi:hypothetical protein